MMKKEREETTATIQRTTHSNQQDQQQSVVSVEPTSGGHRHLDSRGECSRLWRGCFPPKNRTLLAIGQDLFSIEEYLLGQYNYSLHHHLKNDSTKSTSPSPSLDSFRPAVAMFYTDIQTLKGLEQPTDYGSGVEYATGLIQDLDFSALQIGLWLNGSAGCRDILQRKLDSNIQRLFEYIIHMHSNSKLQHVFLRVGYEFDNYWFGYSNDPRAFQQAFRRMVDICNTMSPCNEIVHFVWHSWAAGFVIPPPQHPNHEDNPTPLESASLLTLDDFYPGDDYVDWIGISLFSQFYNTPNQLGHLNNVRDVLEFAKRHNHKPVMIAESTPYGGIDEQLNNDPWAQWFQPVLDLIHDPDNSIGMWSYINCDWESQPMWHNVGFGDTRLTTNQTVMELWQTHVLNNNRFLFQLPQHHHNQHHPSDSSSMMMTNDRLAVLGGAFDDGHEFFVSPFFVAMLSLLLVAPLTLGLCTSFRRLFQSIEGYTQLDDIDKKDNNNKDIPKNLSDITEEDTIEEQFPIPEPPEFASVPY